MKSVIERKAIISVKNLKSGMFLTFEKYRLVIFYGWLGLVSSVGVKNSRPATSEHKERRSILMRRDFSVSSIYASPYLELELLRGWGCP